MAKAQLALAQYNLAQTRLVASVQGFVTNLSLRPGDYAKAGVPIIGIVDDTQWRVVANFKEYVAARLKPGARAWIWLDSHPWRLFPPGCSASDGASLATRTSSASCLMWRRRPTGFACRVGCR